MKLRFGVVAVALLLVSTAGGFSDQVSEDYSKLMKPAAAANGALQKSVDADLSAAAMNAKEVQANFAKVEEFWSKRGVADAQGFAKNIQSAAADVASAAAAGDKEGA